MAKLPICGQGADGINLGMASSCKTTCTAFACGAPPVTGKKDGTLGMVCRTLRQSRFLGGPLFASAPSLYTSRSSRLRCFAYAVFSWRLTCAVLARRRWSIRIKHIRNSHLPSACFLQTVTYLPLSVSTFFVFGSVMVMM
jgi:hypothetical protein